MNAALDLLLSRYYDGALHPEAVADLKKSGLTPETIRTHKIRSVPVSMISRLLGFDAPQVRHAYLIPFPDPAGGWMDHIRLKVFPAFTDRRGSTVKYLGPRGAGPRLFFPLVTMEAALHGDLPLYLVEGAKKGLAVAQLDLPAVGFEGIEAWHGRGSCGLLADFDFIRLQGRTVELVPDGDWRTNPHVRRGAERLAEALEARGARPRLVVLPEEVAA